MKSWHDYHIIKYEVDSKDRSITFILAWPYETEKEIKKAKLIFKGVVGYNFENDAFGNVILDIEEMKAEELAIEKKEYIENSFKWSGAFGEWAKTIDNLSSELSEKGIKGYVLSPSYGMSGWVLSKKVEEEIA